jgi:ubiquinone/menaquinone biosynthesis C-methylase UbiE
MGGEMTGDERLRGLWDRYAPRYDRDIGLFERLQFGGGREWVCARAEGDVLEVAVGTGLNLPHYPDTVRLTGVDFSPAMLDQARRRAAGLGRDVVLIEADAQALPFPDASFDTVVCTLGLVVPQGPHRHQLQQPLPLVEAAGFVVERAERLKAGTVERLDARKPEAAAG